MLNRVKNDAANLSYRYGSALNILPNFTRAACTLMSSGCPIEGNYTRKRHEKMVSMVTKKKKEPWRLIFETRVTSPCGG